MKKVFLSLATSSVLLLAQSNYKYEVTPVIGANIAQDKLNLEDTLLYGVQVQSNVHKYFGLKPQIALERVENAESTIAGFPEADITRVALNGVYDDFSMDTILKPYLLGGFGYEEMNGNRYSNNDSIFFNIGAGVKYYFENGMNLNLMVKELFKFDHGDREFSAMAGIGIPFGEIARKPAPAPAKPVIKHEEPAPVVAEPPVVKFLDDDNDGVENSVDKCPTTKAGLKVDKNGCAITIKIEALFIYDTSTITPETDMQKILDFAKFLNENKMYGTIINGHTDSVGSLKYNQKLSERRAIAIKNILIENGVEASRIKTIGYGEVKPIATNKTKEGRALNRRIEANLTY